MSVVAFTGSNATSSLLILTPNHVHKKILENRKILFSAFK